MDLTSSVVASSLVGASSFVAVVVAVIDVAGIAVVNGIVAVVAPTFVDTCDSALDVA